MILRRALVIAFQVIILISTTKEQCETKTNQTFLVRKNNAPDFCNCRDDAVVGCTVLNNEYPDYYSCNGLTVFDRIQCCEFKHLVKCCKGWKKLYESCSIPVCSPLCMNGGFCTAPDTCTCRQGFSGSVCQTPICSPTCENGGSCTAPGSCYCAPGYTGPSCSNGICNPPCQQGGICVSPQLCKCKPGYYGDQCEKGDDLNNLYESTLQLADPLSSINTWYRIASPYSKACFLKIFIKLTDPDDVVTFSSESFDKKGTFLGNYTTLALDERNSLALPLRSVCLSVKCPEDEGSTKLESLNTIKVVTKANTNLRCNITSAKPPTTRGNEDNKVETLLRNGNDYGPLYGIYVAYGSTMSAKTIAEKMCRLGSNFFNHDQAILPGRYPNSVYDC